MGHFAYTIYLESLSTEVIVKLANVHLTPERPHYSGGGWHVEGLHNERIVASALYYYNSDNVTDSFLAFREGVDCEELGDYEQYRYDHLTEQFGIVSTWGQGLQTIGRVNTREDRLLVFPNVLQHRVSPFELLDKSRPGHRKLLALFLVDPSIQVISTANIPPQRRDWWLTEWAGRSSLTQRLPGELFNQIAEDVDFPLTLDQAKEVRVQSMAERSKAVDDAMYTFTMENGYSFCEH